jgi:hypothetical protein
MSFYPGWDETVKPEKAEIWEIATWVCLSGCLDSVACKCKVPQNASN